jgi:hypothetical protein
MNQRTTFDLLHAQGIVDQIYSGAIRLPREVAMAEALIAFLNMSGGADGQRTGFGDPRKVRAAAVAALAGSGFKYEYGKAPFPPDEAERERQKGTLHPGGIRTPGFVSPGRQDMESFYERERDFTLHDFGPRGQVTTNVQVEIGGRFALHDETLRTGRPGTDFVETHLDFPPIDAVAIVPADQAPSED